MNWGLKASRAIETDVIYTIALLYGIIAASLQIVSENPVAKKTLFDSITDVEKEMRSLNIRLIKNVIWKIIKKI